MVAKRDTYRKNRLLRLTPIGFLFGAALLLASAIFDSPSVVAYGFTDGPVVWRMNMIGLSFLFSVFFLVTWDLMKRAVLFPDEEA